jgi:MFS transporter, Spinster family, sphingosine-1-phosphate transporter
MQKKLSPFWTLFILTGLNLFNYIDRYILSAVLPSVQKTLEINDADAGRLFTAFMLGYFVTSPFFGYLGDRASRKWLIALGIFVWSLGTVLTGYAGALAVMLLFRGIVGVGEASYATISPGWISDTYGREKRNNALTISKGFASGKKYAALAVSPPTIKSFYQKHTRCLAAICYFAQLVRFR